MNHVLMVARSFPPFRSVGGSIRVVKFIRYLPLLGWRPVVLTIDDGPEYETTRKLGNESLLSDLPAGLTVHRTPAGEPTLAYLAREQAFARRGKPAAAIVRIVAGARRWVLRSLFLPDRYLGWLPFAVRRGRRVVSQENIDVILATCPPHSAALVGACLKARAGRPLVLDFRDDWIDTPWFRSRPGLIRGVERWLERWAVRAADRVILVTEWSRRLFVARYPREPESKFVLIPNGCDLAEFAGLRTLAAEPDGSCFKIVHAGLLNDSDAWRRSPESFFQAIRCLVDQTPALAGRLSVGFTGQLPERYRQLAAEMGVSGFVHELGHLPRPDFLRLLARADLLLAINYEDFSMLIPGKLYEYWAVGGPPILLLDGPGAAQQLVENNGLGLVASPGDAGAIQEALRLAYGRWAAGNPLRVSTAGIEAYDRKALTARLAQVLTEVVSRPGGQP